MKAAEDDSPTPCVFMSEVILDRAIRWNRQSELTQLLNIVQNGATDYNMQVFELLFLKRPLDEAPTTESPLCPRTRK